MSVSEVSVVTTTGPECCVNADYFLSIGELTRLSAEVSRQSLFDIPLSQQALLNTYSFVLQPSFLVILNTSTKTIADYNQYIVNVYTQLFSSFLESIHQLNLSCTGQTKTSIYASTIALMRSVFANARVSVGETPEVTFTSIYPQLIVSDIRRIIYYMLSVVQNINDKQDLLRRVKWGYI